MRECRILTNYLLPTMLQAVVIALITAVLRQSGVETGYATASGIIVSGGFRAENLWLPILLFLKAIHHLYLLGDMAFLVFLY